MPTTIEVKLLFSLEMQVESSNQIGDFGGGTRAIGDVSGRFEGAANKNGTITGTDWYLARPDSIGEADVRAMMKTDDGVLDLHALQRFARPSSRGATRRRSRSKLGLLPCAHGDPV